MTIAERLRGDKGTLEFGAIGDIHTGVAARRQGSRYSFVPPTLFPALDGLVAGGIGGSPRMWGDLVAWMSARGQAHHLADPVWQDDAVRLRGREQLFQVLEAFTAGFSKATFYHEAQRRRLPWAPVDGPEDVARNPQLAARGFFVETTGDEARGRDVGFAFAFPEGARPESLAVPACGPTRR